MEAALRTLSGSIPCPISKPVEAPRPFDWSAHAAQQLATHNASRNAEAALWFLLERCGSNPGRAVTSYVEIVSAAGVSSEGAARRSVKKLEEIGLVRVDRDASRPGRLVVDVMRPWTPDPQRVFEFAEGPKPLPPSAPLRLQVAAAAEALPEPDPVRRPARAPARAPSTAPAPPTAVTREDQPAAEKFSAKAMFNKRLAEIRESEESSLARGSLSLSRSSPYLDPLTFSPSNSPSEKGALEVRSREGPPAMSDLGQRILDRERELWRRVASPGLYRWVTVWSAYLIETGKVPESVIEDVAYSCKLTVQDGRTRAPGMVSPGQLFAGALRRRLTELGHEWPNFRQMRLDFRAVGLVWQTHWDGFKPGGKGR